jgi:hypothetical protein
MVDTERARSARFRTDWRRREEAMKIAGRETPRPRPSEQILLHSVSCEAGKTPAAAEAFFLTSGQARRVRRARNATTWSHLRIIDCTVRDRFREVATATMGTKMARRTRAQGRGGTAVSSLPSPGRGPCARRSSPWMRHEAGMNSFTGLQTRACSHHLPPPADPSLCRSPATGDNESGSGWAISLASALNAEVRPLCHRIDEEFLKRSC